jgi:Skp family chaperone for outer membrane proteins
MAVSAQTVTNIAIADLDDAVAKSNAYVLAVNQIKITYKAQIDAADARAKALTAELQPLAAAYQTAARAPNAAQNQAALQQQLTSLQQREQAANREVAKISEPVARARAYAQEQILLKLEAAVSSAMTKKRINILLQPQAAIKFLPAADITNDVLAELNVSVPNVSITPPAGWQPGQAGGAQAPAQPQPQGR